MALAREDVERVAWLARLALDEQELALYADQLGEILDSFRKLGELDTGLVEATAHVAQLPPALREDRVTSAPDREALLANAPERDGPFFKVPKIIE